MIRAAGRGAAADRHLGRIGLPRGDEVLHRLERRVGGNEDGARVLDQLRDRRRVGRLDLGTVGVGGADDAEPHRHHEVVVALFVHQPGHRDGAAGADDVEDLDAAGDVVVFHDLDRGARRQVVAAARAVRHHHAQPVESLRLLAARDAAAADQQRCDHGDDQRSPCFRVAFTLVPNHFSCDAQQYWTPRVTHVTDENAKEVLVIKYMAWSRSLGGQFLVFQLLVVVVVLFAVAAVSVAQSTSEFREVRGQRMIAVAENMASTPVVRDRFADPFAAQGARTGSGSRRGALGRGPGGDSRSGRHDPGLVGSFACRLADGPWAQPGRRGPGVVRRRRRRRRAQPGRPGADPVDQRRRVGGRVGERALSVGVGAAQRRRRAAVVLSRPRCGARPARVVAAVPAHQTAHPRVGGRRDRRPRRSPGSVAAQHS